MLSLECRFSNQPTHALTTLSLCLSICLPVCMSVYRSAYPSTYDVLQSPELGQHDSMFGSWGGEVQEHRNRTEGASIEGLEQHLTLEIF